MNDQAANAVLGDSISFAIGLVFLALIFTILSLVAGARLALGDLTAERVAEESGLLWSFDPGGRAYEAAKLLRLSTLVLLVVLASSGPAPWCGPLAGVLVGLFGIISSSLVQGLIAPRRPDRILRAAAPLLRVIDALMGPLLAPLARAYDRLSTQHRAVASQADDDLKGEQLEEVIRDAEEEGLLEPEEGELMREIVDAGDTIVREVMTPRVEIEAVSATATVDEMTNTFIRSRHSRLLVFDGTLDKVLGCLALRDLLPQISEQVLGIQARDLVRPVVHVPATKPVLELLRELQRQRLQMAVIVDEYGNTAGLLTLEDLVEVIVGDIRDEHELPDEGLRPDGKGGFLVDGLMSVEDVKQRTGLEFPAEGVETLGGLVFSQFGRLPRVGERVVVGEAVVLEVARMQGRRIATVRVVAPTAASS